MQIIGFEPIVDSDTNPFVHHFVVRGSIDANNDATECTSPEAVDNGDGNTPTEPIEVTPQVLATLLTTSGNYQESV